MDQPGAEAAEHDHWQRIRELIEQGPAHVFWSPASSGATTDPSTFDLGGVEILGAAEALNEIGDDEKALAVACVARAMTQGSASEELRLVDGTWVTSHLFDLSEQHGLILGIAVPSNRSRRPCTAERGEVPARVGHLTENAQGRILSADNGARRMLGYGSEPVPPDYNDFGIHPEDWAGALTLWASVLAGPGQAHRTRGRLRHRDGHYLWCEITLVNQLDDPIDPRVEMEVVDISTEMAAHDAVRARERLLQRLAESLPDGVLQLDADREVAFANRRAQELLGPHATLDGLMDLTLPADRSGLEAAIDAALGSGEDHAIEVRVRRPASPDPDLDDGADVPASRDGSAVEAVYEVTLRAVTDDGPATTTATSGTAFTGAICCIADVTDRARERRELEVRATLDHLTGTCNRVTTLQSLTTALADAGPGAGVAVVFVDLDDFKQVNDTHGHTAGDLILQAVADRLRGAVREVDIVGRLGGDEFLVVCPRLTSPDRANEIAARLREALTGPVETPGALIAPSASLGVAWTFDRGVHPNELIRSADESMYQAKRART